MRRRLLKKLAKIEIDFHGKKQPYQCPTCGWDGLEDEEYKYTKCVNFHHVSNADNSYKTWDAEVKCPYCKTEFGYEESSN